MFIRVLFCIEASHARICICVAVCVCVERIVERRQWMRNIRCTAKKVEFNVWTAYVVFIIGSGKTKFKYHLCPTIFLEFVH